MNKILLGYFHFKFINLCFLASLRDFFLFLDLTTPTKIIQHGIIKRKNCLDYRGI
jgi:hypothetical protein